MNSFINSLGQNLLITSIDRDENRHANINWFPRVSRSTIRTSRPVQGISRWPHIHKLNTHAKTAAWQRLAGHNSVSPIHYKIFIWWGRVVCDRTCRLKWWYFLRLTIDNVNRWLFLLQQRKMINLFWRLSLSPISCISLRDPFSACTVAGHDYQ